jgi:hypothetical protein
MQTAFPLAVHALVGPAADLLGVGADDAVLVRPDARLLARWPTAGDPRADVGPIWSYLAGLRPQVRLRAHHPVL